MLTKKQAALFWPDLSETSPNGFQMFLEGPGSGSGPFSESRRHRLCAVVSTEGNGESWLMEKIRGQKDLELPLLLDIFVVF